MNVNVSIPALGRGHGSSDLGSEDLLHLFRGQVAERAHEPAVITADRTIAYAALAHLAATVAASLSVHGVGHEEPIGILLPRGIEQIASQIAVLMAGGSCVPLDPDMPAERLNDMLEDLSVRRIIATADAQAVGLSGTILPFGLLARGTSGEMAPAAPARIAPGHRTHVLFTSGTTGRPKAVQIEARGITRLVVNSAYVRFTPQDRTACIANPTFDASLFEIWGALLNGAATVVFPKKDVLDIASFQEDLVRRKITIAFVTATLFNLIATTYPAAFRTFRYLLVGGEALNPHTLRLVLEAGAPEHLLNGYGPTESTTFALTHDIGPDDLAGGGVPIGRPIDRTSAFILADDLTPAAPGETGNLFIGGEGLSRGYWNRDELNAERFVTLALPGHGAPQRLYRTGDLGWQREDGVFMYAGRLDNQVKIRGHRIELEDVEAQLLKSDAVRSATVCAVKNEGADDFLAAFVVPRSPGALDRKRLADEVSAYLPAYMLPRFFEVDSIPMTPTGKADRRKLLSFLEAQASAGHRPSGFDDTQYAVYRIWSRILNNADIRLDDNFFQLGGSSLQAARLVIELDRLFARRFSMQTLYDAGSLRELVEIATREEAPEAKGEEEDWLRDGELPADIVPLAQGPRDWANSPAAKVFLTGATGFLAAFFLRDLLARENVAGVVCLVRASDDAAALRRIEENLSQYGLWEARLADRIEALAGDLSKPQFGLGKALHDELAGSVDVVFHLGAHVNYIQPYRTHRAANVEGTLNVLRFATSGRAKALHYASTIAAYGPAGMLGSKTIIHEDESLAPYLEIMKYDSGYSQSQWVVEQFVWQARDRGIPLSVYRPGFIMGDSVRGAGNPNDFVARLIRGCVAIGAYPELPRQRKELIPVDYVSGALLTIASDLANLGRAYHLVPPQPEQSIDLDRFFELLGECGYSLRQLPYGEWVARLDADPNLDDNALMPLLPMLSEPVHGRRTRWEVYENMPAYHAGNANAALARAGSSLRFTPMGPELLSRYLAHWRAAGHLPERTTEPSSPAVPLLAAE